MARKAPLSGFLIEVAGYYTYPESTPLTLKAELCRLREHYRDDTGLAFTDD